MAFPTIRGPGSRPSPATGRSTGCGGRPTSPVSARRCKRWGGLEPRSAAGADVEAAAAEDPYPDERLRLIFTCCHPALAPASRVALTLRTLGGLTTAEIARAYLTSDAAMAQRLVRAKHKIRAARISYEARSRATARAAAVGA